MAENNVALLLAEAEREMRRRQSPSSEGSFTPVNVVNELNRGLLNLVPSAAREKLQSIGVGVETGFSNTAAGKGTEFVGGAVPFMLAAPAMGVSIWRENSAKSWRDKDHARRYSKVCYQ